MRQEPTVLALAIGLEALAFYLILSRSRVVVAGLLYVRLGIRIAPYIPHSGTSLLAAGMLMLSYFVSSVFPILGLVLANLGISVRVMNSNAKSLDKLILIASKRLGMIIIRGELVAFIRTLITREELKNITPRKRGEREKASVRRSSSPHYPHFSSSFLSPLPKLPRGFTLSLALRRSGSVKEGI